MCFDNHHSARSCGHEGQISTRCSARGPRSRKEIGRDASRDTVSRSSRTTGRREQIPQEFQTSSRLAIITNEWKTLNRNVAALQDRGHLVIFEPSPQEVHTRTAEWFWDQEIYDFVGERLHLLQEASMRHYVAAWELKRAGVDWRGLVLSRCLSGKQLLVAQLKADPAYATEEARSRAFNAAGGGCRATYFNLARQLRPVEFVPYIRLATAEPPRGATPPKAPSALAWRRV